VPFESPQLELAIASDAGHVRQNNEDVVAANLRLGLIVLADGMGGHKAGEVASNLAVAEVQAALTRDDPSQPPHLRLQAAVGHAHNQVHAKAQRDPACTGMGTTLVAALFRDDQIGIAHVGDSRLYRFRDGVLHCMTRDHSLLEEMVAAGQYSREEARKLVRKNVVTRALGLEPFVDIELQMAETALGDLYLACSDGLNDMIGDDAIAARLLHGQHAPAHVLADALIGDALAAGGRDNVSVVVARIRGKKPWYQRLLDHF